jgi:hypothetical protein
MRNSATVIGLLLVFGLVPVAAWFAMAANLDPGGLGRSIGGAILVMMAPLALAGLLMILGAVTFNRTRSAGRVLATIGAGTMLAGTGTLAAVWLGRVGRCVEGSSYCMDLVVESAGAFLYAAAQGVLIVLIWRARRDHSPATA